MAAFWKFLNQKAVFLPSTSSSRFIDVSQTNKILFLRCITAFRYKYTLWNNHHNQTIDIFINHGVTIFCDDSMIHPLSKFSVYNAILLTILTLLYNILPEIIQLSVQFSCSVVSDYLWSHESQHARPPCLSPSPGIHSDSRPLSRWCHPAISSSADPFSSCPQSLPASGSFPMSQLFQWPKYWSLALASFLPINTQDWSPLGWTGWTSLQSKGLSRVFSNTTVQKHQFFGAQLSSQSNSHIHTWP